MYAKALAVGLRKRVEEWTGEADFENDCIVAAWSKREDGFTGALVR
jgi:hypothetical protein